MSKEKETTAMAEALDDLLIDFDEMGFAPTTTCPDPDAYAIEWKRKLLNVLQGYRKQSEWISVEERLPTEDGRYLVVQNDRGRIRQNVRRFATNLKKVNKYDFYYKGDMSAGWYEYNDGEYYEVDDITHWMPLPEPPKGVANER